MIDKDRLALLYKVASMYYEQGLKKFKIANAIDQSPTQVSNLLKEAERAGILRIRVDLPRIQVLQEKLKARFGLREAIVIPSDNDVPMLLRNLGRAAALYFEEITSNIKTVALGGGYLVYEMITALPDRRRDIEIYPAAIVGRGPRITHIDPTTLVTLLWARSGHIQGRAHYVTVTPPENKLDLKRLQDYYKQLQKNRRVKDLMDSMKAVDTVFASVGGFEADDAYFAATRYTTGNLLEEMNLSRSDLRGGRAVGDIVYSFFDEDGKSNPDWTLGTSLGIKHLKEMSATPDKSVVVIVGGYKQKSVRAVLRGHICNVLITDANAAEEALRDS